MIGQPRIAAPKRRVWETLYDPQVEAALVGQSFDRLVLRRLAELAVADTAPFDDHHASAEYRRTVARRVFERVLREALSMRQAARAHTRSDSRSTAGLTPRAS